MSDVMKKFLAMESASGILLILAATAAILIANSGFGDLYTAFLNTEVQIRVNSLNLDKSLLLWVNDGLMAVFFLLIGLEVKRELIEGALSRREHAIFPAMAALGGMVFPALWFLAFNALDPEARAGWAIPAATDIAFALGVMALLGKRVPISLKVFLLALAIIDDLGAILIIALFYNHGLSLPPLGIALLAIIGLLLLNRFRVGSLQPYLLLGLIMWVAILKSGVHATLAGVMLGFLIPLYNDKSSPLKKLEHALHPACGFIILPLFAFVNAGVSLEGLSLSDVTSTVPLGIMLGLLLGKPMGIFLASWLSVKYRIAQLPTGVTMPQIFAVSVLCGIGFTMSIFIASLAFGNNPELANLSRLGILIGSTSAALIGYGILYLVLPGAKKRKLQMQAVY
ncbi:Na+/H+ antiporter NhaA [Zobellella maritima]|uniref:Na+/H+ antiporter NhaA n=1 Tax=Zobellella maritima TaxID=2059725 RepID=UPI000E308462|nr:Na+/H+ antiporter NhaA [Zobellella maritima]